MALFKQHLVKIGSTAIDGVAGVSVGHGVGTQRPLTDGLTDPKFISIVSMSPVISFSSLAIGKVLTETGFCGSFAKSCVAYDAKIEDCGKDDTSVHVSYTMATAAAIPRGISVSGRGNAAIAVDMIGYSTTNNNPLVVATNAALPADVIDANEVFGMGDVTINGTKDTGIISMDIAFGIQEVVDNSEGKPSPRDVRVMARVPEISVTTTDPAIQSLIVSTASTAGVSAAGLNFIKVSLRRRQNGAVYYADSATEHILFTIEDAHVVPNGTSGDMRTFSYSIKPILGDTASIQIGNGVALA